MLSGMTHPVSTNLKPAPGSTGDYLARLRKAGTIDRADDDADRGVDCYTLGVIDALSGGTYYTPVEVIRHVRNAIEAAQLAHDEIEQRRLRGRA
jgi:hypothetical protein